MMAEQRGPTKYDNLVHHRICNGCKYHSRRMIMSGRDPQYRHECEYPADAKFGEYAGYLGHGSSECVTPERCPVELYDRDNPQTA